MGSKLGALKAAAKRIGMPFENYMAKRNAGLKRCMACKRWKHKKEFGKDRTKGDRLSASCLDCGTLRYTKKRIGTRERRKKRELGLYWCNRCDNWVAWGDMVFGSIGDSKGLCRKHYNETQRERYASNPDVRRKAYLLVKKRRRNTKPISSREKHRLLQLFEGKCAYCEEQGFEEWDHFIPVEHGGKSMAGNILPACKKCNRSKHAENPFDWAIRQGFEFSEKILQVIGTPPEDVVYTHKRNPNQEGELNPTAKLTNVQAREVREKYTTGKYSYSSLAQEYNVGYWVVSRIVRGETYNGC